MRKVIAIFAVGSVVLGLLVAGCGSGGDSSSDEPVDKATFVSEANKICKQASGAMTAKVTSISSKDANKPDFVVTDILIPGIEGELKQIHTLGVPAEAKKDVLAFYKAAEKDLAKAKADPNSVSNDFAPFEAMEVTGTKIGISECPVSPVTGGS